MYLNDLSFIENPYPTYQTLIETPGLWKDNKTGVWFAARYDTVCQLFQHKYVSSNRMKGITKGLNPDTLEWMSPVINSLSRWALLLDPPKHTYLRREINKVFTPTLMNSMRSSIDALCESLLDKAQSKVKIDLIKDYAYPVPATIIAQMMGASPNDQGLFKYWSDTIVDFLTSYIREDAKKIMANVRQSIIEMTDYLHDLMVKERHNPTDSLMSRLIQLQKVERDFSDDDIIANAILLIFAGHETTINLIGNSVALLDDHSETRQMLLHNDISTASFIEESLRFESPVQRMLRIITGPCEIEGQTLVAGELVVLLAGAANRDPNKFENPNLFIPTRHPNRHLAFGFGHHLCSGIALARLEGAVAIDVLLRKMPDFVIDRGASKRSQSASLRGYDHLIEVGDRFVA